VHYPKVTIVTAVTAVGLRADYLLLIEATLLREGASPMTKFYSLVIAALVCAPAAYAVFAQAAQIVA
jgi:hypothetical protein